MITLRRGPGQYGVTQIQLHKSRPARELHVFRGFRSRLHRGSLIQRAPICIVFYEIVCGCMEKLLSIKTIFLFSSIFLFTINTCTLFSVM